VHRVKKASAAADYRCPFNESIPTACSERWLWGNLIHDMLPPPAAHSRRGAAIDAGAQTVVRNRRVMRKLDGYLSGKNKGAGRAARCPEGGTRV
jgi:hypothetical protein